MPPSWEQLWFFLLLLLSVTGMTRCHTVTTTWYSDITFADLMANTATDSFAVRAESKLACGRLCTELRNCSSFFFNTLSYDCFPQGSVFLTANDTHPAPGLRYFRLKSTHCPFEKDYVVHRESKTCFRPVKLPPLKWVDARDTCKNNQETLAILEPIDKLQFLIDFFLANPLVHYRDLDPYLIGASRPYALWNTPYPSTGPDYEWLNGQPLNMTATKPFWVENSPENNENDSNILALRPKYDFKLGHMLRANNKRLYVCEKPYVEK